MHTARLTLRRWNGGDAESLFRYASDPDVGVRAGWPPHKSIDESREVIATLFNNAQTWAIVPQGADEPIGCIGYLLPGNGHMAMAHDEAEVGYWIAKPYWNQGLCSEALQALVAYCFDKQQCGALWGCHYVDNPASGRVMEKCGFVEACCPDMLDDDGKPMRVMKIVNLKKKSNAD